MIRAGEPTSLGDRNRKADLKAYESAARLMARSRFVDVGAYRVLFNMLEHQCPDSGADLMIHVRGASGHAGSVLDLGTIQSLAYPEAAAETPFPVDDNLKEPTDREVMVRVDFEDELTEARTQEIDGVLGTWQGVVQGGGFPGPQEAQGVGTLTLAEHYM